MIDTLFYNLYSMNRRQLVERIAEWFDTTKVNANEMLTTFISIIEKSLLDWQEVNIHWFGKFYISNRKWRLGFNPRTKERMNINSYSTASFKVWRLLKQKLNKKFN